MTVDQNDALSRINNPANDADQRRLSSAVWTQQGKNFSTVDAQVDLVERLEARSVGLGEIGYGNDGLQGQVARLAVIVPV
jgi:hypothetical protein